MTSPFSFGIQTGPFGDPVALREFAKKVEGLGYDSLHTADHVNMGALKNLDPFLPLMVAAEATTTLRFGPLVLNNEFYNPVLLARAAASFDLLSGGRLILGMGTGYAQSEHDATGIELRPPGQRVTRFGESLRVLRSLLDTGSADFAGEHLQVNIGDLGVRPASGHVPILVGGHGKRVVELAGRHADMFQFTGLSHDPSTGSPSLDGLAPESIARRRRWLVDAAGERLGGMHLSVLIQGTTVGGGAQASRDAFAARLGIEDSLVDACPFVLFGTVEQVVEKLHSLREQFGIHHIVSRDPDDLAPVVAALI